MLACGLRFNWVGKHILFKGPLGPIMRAIGGIPVDRIGSTGFLKKVIKLFARRDQFVMAISPEGTRSLTKQWKEGFYRIALVASVPIALAYIDYPRKRIGIDRMFEPSGDIEADFTILDRHYSLFYVKLCDMLDIDICLRRECYVVRCSRGASRYAQNKSA